MAHLFSFAGIRGRLAAAALRYRGQGLMLLGAMLVAALPVRAMVLPPIDGEFSGVFTAIKLPNAPALRWAVRIRTTKPKERVVDLTLEGNGTRVLAQFGLDEAGDGWWKVTSGELDAAAWFPTASAELGEVAAGVTAKGKIEVTGGGALRAGVPLGTVSLAWREGSVENEGDGWRVEGITLRGEFVIEGPGPTIRSTEPLELLVRTISTSRFGARNLAIRGELKPDRTLALAEARIEVAGGTVTVDPETVGLSPLDVGLTLRVTNVGLQDVAALVPAGLSESRGRINGTLRLGWSEAKGFQLGEGNLVLGSTEPAFVRLSPSPGFLTERVPERIDLLPAWLGPVARWFRPENPAFADMREIELGKAELQIENLSVQLTPEGDGQGRTARVKATARPARPGSVVESVTFEINVSGPLAQVLRLGMNQSFSVETH